MEQGVMRTLRCFLQWYSRSFNLVGFIHRLEKTMVTQLMELSAFYGSQRFITVFTTIRL